MNLTNWSPLRGFDDFFTRPMGAFFRGDEDRDAVKLLNAELAWRPAADISETDKEYRVKAQLPGVKKEDVELSVDHGMLTISGERKVEKSTDDEKMHRTESYYGKYSRSFALPEDVDEKNITARCKDGVLTVHLPKTKVKAEAPKKIAID